MAEARGFQYEDAQHEADTAISGMWLFLASEALFFGGLIFVWLMLRLRYAEGLRLGVSHSNLTIGTINTAVLVTSSLAFSVAVQRARAGRGKGTARACVVTAALGALFVALKAFEWWKDLEEGLYPGPSFALTGPNSVGAHLFWDWYWVATALHAFHMLGGISFVLWIAWRARRGEFSQLYATPVEAVGLYWSFVDVVWLTLYPLIYLVARP
ncbi:MAG: cytochrome c oxidase subunit 3 [Acetobacteraceae bacterium]|nr:cytochrome c oxidase subunit 3 [Acetobacteraceae bacterium]